MRPSGIIPLLLMINLLMPDSAAAEGSRGLSGADFLELTTSVRAMGMGETGCAVTGDLNNSYYNPAVAAQLFVPEASFSHQELIEDSRFETVSIGYPFGFGTVYGTSAMFWVPPFDKIDIDGNEVGSVQFMNSVIGVGYAFSFSSFSAGVNAKYIYQRVDTLTTNSVAVDFGVLQAFSVYSPFPSPAENLFFGVAFHNFGTEVKDDPLPRKLRTGVSYLPVDWARIAVDMNEYLIQFSDIYDFTYGFDESFEVNSGLELDYMKLLFLRTGYRLNDGGGYTMGMGFYYAIHKLAFRMDIAMAETRDFGPVYSVGLTLQLAPKVSFSDMRESDRLYREGIEAYVNDDYNKSIDSFRKARSLNPYNKTIDRRINDVEKLMELKNENETVDDGAVNTPDNEEPENTEEVIQPEE